MLCSGRGCESAIAARCCVAFGQFGKLLPVLTTRHLSPKICGKLYKPVFTWLCSMVVKRGDHIALNCSGSTAITVPWSIGSVASTTEMRYAQLHYYKNLASIISRQSFTVDDSDGMAMYNGPRLVSNLSQTFRFLIHSPGDLRHPFTKFIANVSQKYNAFVSFKNMFYTGDVFLNCRH